MPRPLHEQTRTQRADHPERVSADARALSYEPSDAPPRKVAGGVGLVFLTMVLGLAAAALLVGQFDARNPAKRVPFGDVRRVPPDPRLLADPRKERRRIEAAATARLETPGATIEQAMGDVAVRGWSDADEPPPTAGATARAHADSRP